MYLEGFLYVTLYSVGAGYLWFLLKYAMSEMRLRKSFLAATRGWLTGPPILLIAICQHGWPVISDRAVQCFCYIVFLNVLLVWLTLSALEKFDVGLAVHLRAFAPLASLLTTYWMLGASHVPSLTGIAGIVVIMLGVYVLFANPEKCGGWFGPFVLIFSKERTWLLYAVPITAVLAFLLPLDKELILSTNPLFAAGMVCTAAWGIGGSVWVMFDWGPVRKSLNGVTTAQLRSLLVWLFVANLGTLIGHAYMFVYGFPASVGALKRLESLVSVLLGWWRLGEKGLRWRLPGTILIIIGALVIGYGSPSR